MVRKIIKHAAKLLTKEQSLQILKKERKAFYKSIVSVPCPILDAEVHFRNKGFFHLINESNSTHYKTIARDPAEQRFKLMCLEHAPEIITNATEINSTRIVRRKDDKGKWKKTVQYSLVGTCDGDRIRVIVEKVGQGEVQEHQFLSIMRHDKKKRRIKRRSLK